MTASGEERTPGERDVYALVPDAARTALLVAPAPEGGTSLPRVRCGFGAARALEALRAAFDLDIPYLRPVRFVLDAEGRTLAALHELDAPPAGWEPAAGVAWRALGDADPEALAPAELASAVATWLAEQRGAPVPPMRAPWARPGWLAEASRWLEETASASGLEPSAPVELVEQWPLSSVLRLETGGGRVYLKAVFSTFWHEPAVTRALQERHPALLPDVLAVDTERGWMLLRELPGSPLGESDAGRWSECLRAVASIHRAWTGQEQGLYALGVQDRTLEALASDLGTVAEAVGASAEDRARFEVARPEFERRLEQLVEAPVPQTLIHGDLHPWNVMLDGDELRIFDWSDACISHPLFDLPTFVSRTDDVDARASLLDAYLDEWIDLAPLEELRRLYRLAEPLAHVHHAVSYARINAAMEPGDLWWFADFTRGWLTGALDLLESGSQGGDPN